MHAALPLVALVRLGFGGAPTPVRPLADPEAFRALVQGTQASGRAAVVQFSSTRCKAAAPRRLPPAPARKRRLWRGASITRPCTTAAPPAAAALGRACRRGMRESLQETEATAAASASAASASASAVGLSSAEA